MEWITLALAAYGAGLSTALGYLTWRKDRHSIRFFASFHRRDDWVGLVVNVVNTGFRPVTLHDAWFEQDEGGGYLNDLDDNLGLPKRLDEGDQLTSESRVLVVSVAERAETLAVPHPYERIPRPYERIRTLGAM